MSAPTPAQINGSSPETQAQAQAQAQTEAQTKSKLQASDVGWQFVPQYYTFLHDSPQKLHCFYNKRSTFIHGTEGEDVTPCFGQQEIHDRITSTTFNHGKVFVHNIDSQSSIAGGIIIQVIGEIQNGAKWSKFTQTFFLAEQPNGYFVLNDIFRYLKEEDGDEEEEEEEENVAEAEAPVEAVPAKQETETEKEVEEAAAVDVDAVKEEIEQLPASAIEEIKREQAQQVGEGPGPVAEKEPSTAAPAPAAAENKPVEATKIANTQAKSDDPTPAQAAKKEEKPIQAAAAAQAEAPKSAAAESKPVAQAPAAAAPAPAPKPTGPPAPRTWASVSAASKGAWGTALASKDATSSAPVQAPVPSRPTSGQKQQQQQQQQAQPQAQAQATAQAHAASPKFPLVEAAKNVTVRSCFVKLGNWQANGSEETLIGKDQLATILGKFGEVVSVEIVKSKACAFVEFKNIESARKAIIASLLVNQGGDGGIKTADGQRIIVESRKEKEDRLKGAQGGKKAPPAPNAVGGALAQNVSATNTAANVNANANEGGFQPARTGRQHQGGRGGDRGQKQAAGRGGGKSAQANNGTGAGVAQK